MKLSLTTLKETPPWDWPEDAGKMLLGVLRNERVTEADFLLAVELSGDFTVINDELAEALLSILRRGDKSDHVRGRAAISLGPILEHADSEDFDDTFDAGDLPISERTFHNIQESLRKLYLDAELPIEVRRRVLEASVRATADWHRVAIGAAYASDDEEWRLTAVFCMRFVAGFDEQILESLDSKNPDIHCEAVLAAGTWELDAAWPHVAALIASENVEKPLLLAAIEAAATIRPEESLEILPALLDSEDEDIVEAVEEATDMAESAAHHPEDDERLD